MSDKTTDPVMRVRILDRMRRPGTVILTVVFGVMTLAVLFLGQAYYLEQRTAAEEQEYEELVGVRDLKLSQISRWRDGLVEDAQHIADEAAPSVSVAAWLGEGDGAARESTVAWLAGYRGLHGIDRVTIVALGTSRSASTDPGDASPRVSDEAARVVATGRATFFDPYVEAGSSEAYVDAAAPVDAAATGGPRAAVVIRLRLQEYLYPLIRSWPVPSATSETLLVHREGADVVFLNDLRFRERAALRLRLPMTRTDVLAVAAASGKRGVVRGVDYRDVPVLGAIAQVPGSDWLLIAKMDQREAYAGADSIGRAVIVTVLLLLLAAGLGVGVAWRAREAGAYRAQLALEQERRAASEKYEYLSRYANDAVLMVDEDLRLLEVNDRACEMYRYSREQLLSMSVADLRSPATRSVTREDMARVRDAGGALLFEAEHVRNDGTTMAVEVNSRVIGGPATSRYVSVVRDITERKVAEVRLRESEQRLRLAMAATKQGMYDLDLSTGIAAVTPEYMAMLGEDPSLPVLDLGAFGERVHPDDRDVVSGLIDAYTRGDIDEYRTEFRLRSASGEWVWVLSSGKVVERDADGRALRVLGTHTDMTDRRLAEELLHRSQEEFRSIVESSPSAIYLYRLEPGDRLVLVQANPVSDSVIGMDHRDLIGKTIEEAFPNLVGTGIPEMYRRVASGEIGPQSFETSYKDERFTGYYAVSVFRTGPDAIAVEFLDVSERKRAEEELSAYRQHLEALVEDRTAELAASNTELQAVNEELATTNEELVSTNEELAVATAAKSQFLANMSHELRTPLNSIIGFAGVLSQGLAGQLNEEQQRQVGMLRRSGARLLALINDVLDLARIESGRTTVNPSEASVQDIVSGVEAIIRPLADEAGLTLVVGDVPEGQSIRTDEQKLHQVLVNLLTNAVKFTKVGTVSLDVRVFGRDSVSFEVGDTGPGIPPERLSAVFDEFVQVSHDGSKPEGTGLGLAISRRLVMLLGGSLTANSVLGEGSTFVVTLPRRYHGSGERAPG